MSALSLVDIVNKLNILTKQKDIVGAAAFLTAQIEAHGPHPQLLALQAQLLEAAGNFAGALRVWDAVLSHSKDRKTRNRRHLCKRRAMLQAIGCPMASYPTVSLIEQDVRAAIAAGEHDYAFWSLTDTGLALSKAMPNGAMQPGNDSRLDALCLELGRSYAEKRNIAPVTGSPSGPVVFIASAIHEYGGHTRVMLDYMQHQPGRKHVMLLTVLGIQMNDAIIEKVLQDEGRGADLALLRSDQERYDTNFEWIAETLRNLRPAAIYLFQHPHDVLPVALSPLLNEVKVYFNHHADATFSFGASLPFDGHIDQTPHTMHLLCEHTKGLNPVYVPLTVQQAVRRGDEQFAADRPLRTACCGSHNKFIDKTYAIQYPDAVATILQETGGEHVHIGGLPDEFVAVLRGHLERKGIPPDRFRYIPHVVSLSQSLGELGIDVFLTSFPAGGAKAVIEAMATGTPVLCHVNYHSRFSCAVDLVYPEAPTWGSLTDLVAGLRRLERAELPRHSLLAWQYYERFFSGQAFRAAFDASGIPTGIAPPPLANYGPDLTQRRLDVMNLGK